MNPIQIVWYAAAMLLGAGAAWMVLKTWKLHKTGEASGGAIAGRLGLVIVLVAGSFFCVNASTALSGEDEATVIEAGGAGDLVEDDDEFFGDDFDDFDSPAGEGDPSADESAPPEVEAPAAE